MSHQPRPRPAPPWARSPGPRHMAPAPPKPAVSAPRSYLSDRLILFWTVTAIVITVAGVAIVTVLGPSLAHHLQASRPARRWRAGGVDL